MCISVFILFIFLIFLVLNKFLYLGFPISVFFLNRRKYQIEKYYFHMFKLPKDFIIFIPAININKI